jgi:hypothetical protein
MKQLRSSTSRDSKQYISLWDLPVFWTTDPILSPENLLTESQEKDCILTLVGRQVYGYICVFKIAFSCLKPTVSNGGYRFPSPVVYDGTLFFWSPSEQFFCTTSLFGGLADKQNCSCFMELMIFGYFKGVQILIQFLPRFVRRKKLSL